ncbi:MAG: hypothetical protein IPH68_06530 [Chitinophagaceae bacterium]|nr:hypothetical protein [Chitinophagaceae bacterium]
MNNNKPTTSRLFMIAGLGLLAAGLLFGLTGAWQYLVRVIKRISFL